jgi:hypothetical protein
MPVAPVGSRVIRIAVRIIVITAWIIRRPVKDRNRDRYRQTETEENPSLRLGLRQQRDDKHHHQNNNKFFHIVTIYRRKSLFPGYTGRGAVLACSLDIYRRFRSGNLRPDGAGEKCQCQCQCQWGEERMVGIEIIAGSGQLFSLLPTDTDTDTGTPSSPRGGRRECHLPESAQDN